MPTEQEKETLEIENQISVNNQLKQRQDEVHAGVSDTNRTIEKLSKEIHSLNNELEKEQNINRQKEFELRHGINVFQANLGLTFERIEGQYHSHFSLLCFGCFFFSIRLD